MTTRANVFVPEVLADAIGGAIAKVNALDGTGAVVVSNDLPETARGGDTVNVPYFGHLGEFEDVLENAALTVASITSTAEQATVQRTGKAFEITNWAQRAAAGDPYAEAARQMAAGVRRKVDSAALAAALTSTLTLDKSAEPLAYAHFVQLLDLFGDEQDDVVAFGVHSKILAAIRQLEDTSGRLLLVDAKTDGQRPTILGRPVFVSDKHTVDANGGGAGIPTYKSLALRRGAVAFWFNGAPNVDTDKDILVDSRVASVNMYYAVHLYTRTPGRTTPGAAVIETQG